MSLGKHVSGASANFITLDVNAVAEMIRRAQPRVLVVKRLGRFTLTLTRRP